MTGLHARRVVNGAALALAAVLLLIVAQNAGAHLPADKAVASGSKRVEIAPGTNKVLLSATLRASNPTDLLLLVSMECTIFTQLVTGPSADGGSDSATATGDVRAWVEIDGNIVPINSVSSPPQTTPPPG